MIKVIHSGTREYEDQKIKTSAKLLSWDRVVTEQWMENSKKRVEAYKLLSDPTLYLYAFFKDKNHNPFTLYPYQDMIINNPHKRIIFCAANQIGKSVTLCCKALHFALQNPGTTTLMISKTLPQAKDLLRQIKMLLRSSSINYKFDIGDSENKTEVYFKHFEGDTELRQSRIICVPATEAALGYAADLMLIDEIAFYDNGEYFYYQIAQPRTYTTKGQIVVFSNPNGQQGIFWELWNNPDFHRYQFNFLDKPGNTQIEYDKLRSQLTRDKFESTVDAQFTNPIGGFFTLAERSAMQEKRENYIPSVLKTPVMIFYDLAKVNDRTVRVTGIPVGEGENVGVYVYEMYEYPEKTPYSDIVDDLKQLIKTLGPQNVSGVGWDDTGVGKGVADFIEKINMLGIWTMPIEFSLQNKSNIYTIFKFLAERNMRGENGIKIPYLEQCDRQLSMLRFKKSSRGYLQVHHENESDRDDFCFVKGTLIKTDKGNKPIELLRLTDKIFTRKGYKEIICIGSRESKIMTRFGITGTSDHPFITSKGIEKFKNINVSHMLYTWKEKQSSIKGCDFIDILIQRGDILEFIIGLTQLEINRQFHFIELYGKMRLGLSLKDMLYIIKMVIHLIMNCQIYNVYQEVNTNQIICQMDQRKSWQESILINMLDPKQLNGINLRMEELGIKNITNDLWQMLKNINTFVDIVKKSINQKEKRKLIFVIANAMKNIDGKKRKRDWVYNLTVKDSHEYFANDILVHNCDSLAGLCAMIINPEVEVTMKVY